MKPASSAATPSTSPPALEPQRVLPISRARISERHIAWLRAAFVASSALLFPLVADRPGCRPALAWTVVVVGAIYAAGALVYITRRHGAPDAPSVPRAIADASLTIAWLAATGGVDSPWTVAVALGISVSASSYSARATAGLTAFYLVAYLTMAVALGQAASRAVDLGIHAGLVVLGAVATGVVAHERRLRLTSRLRLSRTMQELAHVGSWEWTLATNELTWSDELRRIFGLPHGEPPTLEYFTQAIHPDDREHVFATVRTALAERRALLLDHRIVLPDGSVRWLHCRGMIFEGADGAPVSLAGSSQDVTEQKTLEAKLVLSDRLASIGTMASGIAHEINNPLAYVATNLEVIDRELAAEPRLDRGDRRGPDLARVHDALDAARHGSERVREIVRTLRTFARPDEQSAVAVDLARVVDFAARVCALEIEPRARLVREYEPVGPVLATSARLTQVFVNLFVNAAQAIHHGGPEQNEIRVRIGDAGDGRAFVEIRDTGSGIPDAVLRRIFDPFFTTKPPGVGTGLGLSICHRIVSDLSGEITAESKLGEGSTFRVVLPLAADGPAPAAVVAPESSVSTAVPRHRVLVVDDEARYARSLKLLLDADYDVELAPDGERALELVRQGARFDVILCDLMMPRMSGMELHAELAELAPDQRDRMVFLTGGATNERASAFLARDDVRFLEKPLELDELHAVIADVVRACSSVARAAS